MTPEELTAIRVLRDGATAQQLDALCALVARVEELEAGHRLISGGSVLSNWKQIALSQQEISRRVLRGES